MKKTIRLLGSRQLPSTRDATEYLFDLSIVDSNLLNTPEERSSTKTVAILVGISGTLHVMWVYKDPKINLEKVLYEFGKRHIIQKIQEGTLLDKEELWLTTASHPEECPFDSAKINMARGTNIEIEVTNGALMQNLTLLQLATSIIETRDYINGLIMERSKQRLFSLQSERDLLQFFNDASTVEEFVYRLSALKNVVTSLNDEPLRKETGIQDSAVGSLSLLDAYLKKLPSYDEQPIKVLRAINRLRQAYPIHPDTGEGILEAHRFFGFPYPITEYSKAWKSLLLNYSDALKRIFEMLRRSRS